MARNPASSYGIDIACMRDADSLFTSATGLDVVKQAAFHRVTTESVLGPGGSGWGFDCRRLLGMPASKLSTMQPTISEVLQRDDRILGADVSLTQTTTRGLADVRLKATCITAEGPFDLIMNVLDLTVGDLERQGQ